MKNVFGIVFLVLVSSLWASKVVQTEIDSVTVYLNGAEVHRGGNVSLPAGMSELRVSGLTHFMNTKSVQARIASKDVKIMSISTMQTTSPIARVKALKDSIDDVSISLQLQEGDKTAYTEEKNMLLANKARVGVEKGVTVEELKSASQFYRLKLQEINHALVKLDKAIADNQKVKNELEKKLRELSGSDSKPFQEIVIQVKAMKAVSTTLGVNYVVNNASWLPTYNIRSKGVEDPLLFEYLAKVYNRTEEDWNNVRLTLSTGEPLKSIYKPTISPWLVNYEPEYDYSNSASSGARMRSVSNAPRMMKSESVSMSMDQSFAMIQVSELGVDFKIKEKYTIASNQQFQLVDVNEYTVDANYHYFVVPKVDEDAFLLAEIREWENLNILDGTANVYFNGKYVGETHLSTASAGDTLEISLGRDQKIDVNRVKKQDFNEKKMIGVNRTEKLAYEISIRNTYKTPVEIEAWDQIPVSQESTIEVEVKDISGAKLDALSGKLEWETTLKPSETKKYNVIFTIKYPRNKTVKLRKDRSVAAPRYY